MTAKRERPRDGVEATATAKRQHRGDATPLRQDSGYASDPGTRPASSSGPLLTPERVEAARNAVLRRAAVRAMATRLKDRLSRAMRTVQADPDIQLDLALRRFTTHHDTNDTLIAVTAPRPEPLPEPPPDPRRNPSPRPALDDRSQDRERGR